MKNPLKHPISISPGLCQAAKNVLVNGETVSGFIEQAVRAEIAKRIAQREFLARGIASRDEARQTGEYFTVDEVLRDLDDALDAPGRVVKAGTLGNS
ncbi:MAG: prevent-host-death protein [Pseudomonadota bacterium]